MADWQPSASIQTLKRRAALLDAVRRFFQSRQVLEVETPILAQATLPDRHIKSFHTEFQGPFDPQSKTYYLQTSPEFHMKRLLAAGSGPIFQISKAFRDEEAGKHHNPEFTLLEWYQPGWDHHQLMQEVGGFFKEIAGVTNVTIVTYKDLFVQHCGFDPHRVSLETLRNYTRDAQIDANDNDTYLDYLMTHYIEPQFNPKALTLVHAYPQSQAALAKCTNGVASRFEAYWQGVELANGFDELTCPNEQRTRFANMNTAYPMPERLLACLTHMPQCAGVALGLDRLLMRLYDYPQLSDTLSFDYARA